MSGRISVRQRCAASFRRRILQQNLQRARVGVLGAAAVAAAELARQRARQYWVRSWINRRQQFGFYHQLMNELREENVGDFINFMRMPPEMFDEILERIRGRITKQKTRYRDPLEPGLKLAVTLRHLASGDKYASLKFGFRVPANTMSVLVREVCEAIIEEFKEELMPCPTTPEGWRPIIDEFERRWNFLHTCGAIDGKHVAIRKPAKSGSWFYNYKGLFSIVMLALVGPDYKFLYVDVGARGAASDAQIYNNSELKACMEDNSIGFPDPEILPRDNQDPIPFFVVGDDAFALNTYMMKPFARRGLHLDEMIFNYRLSRARRVSENAFGILANRFQILLTTMQHAPSTVKLIVETCCLLHNLMRTRYPGVQNVLLDREDEDHNVIPGEWRKERRIMADLAAIRAPNTASRNAKRQRLLLKHYVNSSAGSVPWQLSKVQQH
ncbi:uncharacterized protein [Montipora capricornis]|uniref:uncharacterized protein n=1 Tax=Montipora capricornis TaxID=246305 RepID=UPI0035F15850